MENLVGADWKFAEQGQGLVTLETGSNQQRSRIKLLQVLLMRLHLIPGPLLHNESIAVPTGRVTSFL